MRTGLYGAPGETFIPFAIAHSARGLFVPQRLDRVHARGALGQEVAEQHADVGGVGWMGFAKAKPIMVSARWVRWMIDGFLMKLRILRFAAKLWPRRAQCWTTWAPIKRSCYLVFYAQLFQ